MQNKQPKNVQFSRYTIIHHDKMTIVTVHANAIMIMYPVDEGDSIMLGVVRWQRQTSGGNGKCKRERVSLCRQWPPVCQ